MFLSIAFALLAASALVPVQDWRNTYHPNHETRFSMPRYASRGEWEARKQHLRRQILSAAGLLPVPPRTPVKARLVGRTNHSGIVVETLLVETLPGYYVGANLYRPQESAGAGPFPVVLSPHGHWKHGRLEHRPSYSVPALGVNLARQGYLVLAWDMVGYNDTTQTPHAFGGWREQLWSFNPLGLQLWNSMRMLDYAAALDTADPDRIAVTGASGGGTQAFLLAAVDGRIAYSAPVNMISAHMQGGDPCEEAPGLRLDTFNVEFAAMMAPRPMLIVSSTRDWTRETPRVELPAIRAIYELYGAGSRVSNAHVDAGHNYNRESRQAVYRFLASHALYRADGVDLSDHDAGFNSPEKLNPLRAGGPPAGALDYEGLFGQWRAEARRRAAAFTESELREALRYALGVEWPGKVASLTEGRRLVLSRAGRHDRVEGLWMPGAGGPVLVVDSRGAEAARLEPVVKALLDSGRFLFLIDVFQTGGAKTRPSPARKYFLSYNRTGDANRVQDILTALAFLESQTTGPVQLLGLGRASVWCLFAAATAPVRVRLSVDLAGFEGSDEDFRDHLFVPGIQRAGGLAGAMRLIAAKD